MTERKVGTLEESVRQSQDALIKAMREAGSDEERLSYSLRLVVEPAWSTWVKESGAKPSQIARAVMELSASLMAETIQNVAKPGTIKELADQMCKIVAEKTLYYCTEAPVLAEVDAFRRRDA